MANPGFPGGGGGRRGRQHTIFAKFSRKLNEIERIWASGGGGGAPKSATVNPTCTSINFKSENGFQNYIRARMYVHLPHPVFATVFPFVVFSGHILQSEFPTKDTEDLCDDVQESG